ncbi:hypothetical protein TSUD_300890 [Trifolium subterraneum]|uniref:Uncharacterized protein n=1 Tax=Trifolium subterraneum TaxID=3900 RepID=A0A2Z6P411_TRISU|nr:hypothetical protein TSUD_300890 [Trifolium subterraneum]
MKVRGTLQGVPLTLLVDSGATHGLEVTPAPNMVVKLSDGHLNSIVGQCKDLVVIVQGLPFRLDAPVFELGDINRVLGITCIGCMWFDWNKKLTRFYYWGAEEDSLCTFQMDIKKTREEEESCQKTMCLLELSNLVIVPTPSGDSSEKEGWNLKDDTDPNVKSSQDDFPVNIEDIDLDLEKYNVIDEFNPLVFGFLTLLVPSGLGLYWFTNEILNTSQKIWLPKLKGAKNPSGHAPNDNVKNDPMQKIQKSISKINSTKVGETRTVDKFTADDVTKD